MQKCKDDKFRIVTLPDEDNTVPSSNPAVTTSVQESNVNQVPAESTTSTESGINVNIKTDNVLNKYIKLF